MQYIKITDDKWVVVNDNDTSYVVSKTNVEHEISDLISYNASHTQLTDEQKVAWFDENFSLSVEGKVVENNIARIAELSQILESLV